MIAISLTKLTMPLRSQDIIDEGIVFGID